MELNARFEAWKPKYEEQALAAAKERHKENRLYHQELKPHIEPALREREESYRQQQQKRSEEKQKTGIWIGVGSAERLML